MKILLDMNIPPIWEKVLGDNGHNAIHWSKVGDIRAADTEIMAWARDNDHVVFTYDLDFSALLHATNATKPSVIQLRAENILPAESANILIEAIETVADQLKNGALITIDPKRYRIRLLPFGKDKDEV